MVKIPFRLMTFLLKIIMLFISKKRYITKVASIKSMDEKNKGFDLKGWQYKKVNSRDGSYFHRYYYYPCENDHGHTLLLLHGLNFDGRTFINMKDLATSYTLIAYDFPEKWDQYSGSIDDFLYLIDDLINVMQLKIFSLIGVSFGGVVAIRFAAKNSSVVKHSLICISTPVAGYNKTELLRSIRFDTWIRSLSNYQLYWFLEKAMRRFEKRFKEGNRSKISGMLHIKNLGYYRQVIAALRDYSAVDDVKKIKKKVLVFHGTRDLFFSFKEAHRFKGLIPHAEIQIIEGGTHAMSYLRGGDIAKIIYPFYI